MTAARTFHALLRLYPRRARERFGEGLLFAWEQELARARGRGAAAVAGFWIATTIDTFRYALAERTGGFNMRGFLTIDWRDAWRSLRAAPMVTIFCVLSLALGIGGVTALFSILNSLVLKSLPVREPQRLALLADDSWTNPIWEAIRERRQTFAEDAFAWGNTTFNLSPNATADVVEGFWVSGNMFDVLGVPAALGRPLTAADDVRGGGTSGPVAVISHAMWQRRYGGASDVIGKTILVERVPFMIVGVTPKGFFGPDVGRSFTVALPLGAEPLVMKDRTRLDGRRTSWMNIMARLRPGQTVEEATALLRAIQPEIRRVTMPDERNDGRDSYLGTPFRLVAAAGGRSPLRGRYEQPLRIILGAVALVLLIACANVANLLIARASDRRHELTLRLALGASRWRIARQLLVESLCLGTAGAALGVWFAAWGSRLLVAQLSSVLLTVDLDLQPDWRVLGFATLVTLAATLVVGVAPALSVSRIAPNDVLKEHGRGGSLDRRGLVRHASVVLQVALSLTLAAGAGLFARTFVALDTRNLGVDRDVLLVSANVDRNPARGEARNALFARMTAAVQAVPGVSAAALSYTTPLARSGRNTRVNVPEGSPLTDRQRATWVNIVSPRWFETMGLRFVSGRDFDGRDRTGAPLVTIVNRAFARRFLPGVEPIGARFSTEEPGPGGDPTFEVIGLVEDSVYRNVREEAVPTIYLPFSQEGATGTMTIAIRSAVSAPSSLAHAVASALEKEDPAAVLTFRLLDEQVAAALTQERVLATVAVFFGALGLLLAGVGLYGVTSYAVTSRRAEIGIRMALGASTDRVVRLILIRVAWLVAIGVGGGAALSAWAGTFVQALLYGLEPRDPATFAVAALVLAVVATLAAWIPARRASRVDPMIALRP